MSEQPTDATDSADPNSPLSTDAVAPAPTPLPVATMQRLAFIRHLYDIAVEQSRQPEPAAALAILSLHDAVELFLHLAAEHTNANPGKKPEFNDYFGVIDGKLKPASLSQRASMGRLNNARVSLKHHGTLPARLAIEQLRSDVTRFFEDNVPRIFGVEFAAISLVDLVKNALARNALTGAIEAMANGDTLAARGWIVAAFSALVTDYERRVRARYPLSPSVFGPSFVFASNSLPGAETLSFDGPPESTNASNLMAAVVALQESMNVLAMGLDYRRYTQFRLLAPIPVNTVDATFATRLAHGLVGTPYLAPTTEDCQFCFDFVIDAALRIQEFDIVEP